MRLKQSDRYKLHHIVTFYNFYKTKQSDGLMEEIISRWIQREKSQTKICPQDIDTGSLYSHALREEVCVCVCVCVCVWTDMCVMTFFLSVLTHGRSSRRQQRSTKARTASQRSVSSACQDGFKEFNMIKTGCLR